MKQIFAWLVVALILADIAWFTYELTDVENLGWTFYATLVLIIPLVLVLARISERD